MYVSFDRDRVSAPSEWLKQRTHRTTYPEPSPLANHSCFIICLQVTIVN